MTDIETALADHLRSRASQAEPVADVDAVVARQLRLTATPGGSNEPRRRGLLVAAAVVVTVGVGGLMWAQQSREEPAATAPPAPAPTVPDVRRSGSIDDPKAIDFSAWIAQAPAWPPGQPSQYLVFDIAALAGWTQLDQTGGHQIGDGASYQWWSNVNDPEGTQFNVSISNSVRYTSDATGDVVDINGVDGNLGEGAVSWSLDDTHTATVVEFGTVDTDRAVALARELTTTTAQSISSRDPQIATGVRADPGTAVFSGTVDDVRWSISGTPDETRFVIDNIADTTIGNGHSLDSIQITESGDNDFCVFVAGVVPETDATVQLVLSDNTNITLPTQPLANGQWFGACLPYALDAVAVEVIAANDAQPVRHELNSPYLRPTIGATSS
jgi:hypothetical protein